MPTDRKEHLSKFKQKAQILKLAKLMGQFKRQKVLRVADKSKGTGFYETKIKGKYQKLAGVADIIKAAKKVSESNLNHQLKKKITKLVSELPAEIIQQAEKQFEGNELLLDLTTMPFEKPDDVSLNSDNSSRFQSPAPLIFYTSKSVSGAGGSPFESLKILVKGTYPDYTTDDIIEMEDDEAKTIATEKQSPKFFIDDMQENQLLLAMSDDENLYIISEDQGTLRAQIMDKFPIEVTNLSDILSQSKI